MPNPSVLYAFCVLAALLLSGCGEKPEAVVAEGTGAPGAVATDAQTATAPAISPEHAAALKGFIASSGGQCADIVRVEGEELSNKVKVTCIEQAGAPGTVSYTVDLESEQARKDD